MTVFAVKATIDNGKSKRVIMYKIISFAEWYLDSVGSQCGAVLLGFIAIVLGFSALCAKNPVIDRVGSICATLSC